MTRLHPPAGEDRVDGARPVPAKWASNETAARLVSVRPALTTLLFPNWRCILSTRLRKEYVVAAAYLTFFIYLIVLPPCFPLFNGHDKAPSGRLPAPAACRRPQDPQPCQELLPHLYKPRGRVPGPVSVDADLGFHFEAIGG
jgi:hypothetical protein